MKSDIEYIGCNACISTNGTLLFADRALSESGREGVVRCAQCGLVYRNIRQTEDAKLQEYAARVYAAPSDDWTVGRQRVFKRHVRKLSRFRQTGHILDVGAGHGFFLAACRAAGWQCRGIEPSVQCRAFAEEKYNLHLSGGSIREFDAQGVLFDVVTFWNVLDQLPSPTEALAATCRLLRPGGVVIIRSPNARFHVPVKKLLRGMGRISPIFYRLDQTVFHLYSFDQHTIRAMLRHAGFNEIKVAPAELSWTTAHHAKSAFIKKPVTLFVELLAKSIFLLSTKQCLLAPSLLVVGHRSPNPHAQNMRGSQRMDWR